MKTNLRTVPKTQNMMTARKITIHQFAEREIYNEALKKLCLVMTDAFNHKKRVLLFLSGGSSVSFYAKLAEWIASKKDIGVNLAFAQVDERYFGEISKSKFQISNKFQNPNSKFQKENINAYQIEQTGLWDVCRDKKIPYFLISQESSLEKAAEEYNQKVERLFEEYDYKIAVLGIGEDGHTAGLLPGYRQKWDVPGFVAGYENEGKFKKRISLTPKALNRMDYALVIAKGDKKRKAIEELLNNDLNTDFNKYPATVIRNMKEADLYTDINTIFV